MDLTRGRVRAALLALTALVLTACGKLDQLQSSPATTPEQWCEQRPCVNVGDTVVNEPLGTFLVFALAALWVGVGIYFIAAARGQRSRRWLGIALILGGLGAAQAGISYQAFSYELKCAGKQVCSLTNGFEVGYSITQAWSVSAMLAAVAFACTIGRARRGLIIFAIINAALYCVVAALGVFLPSALLLSFSVLMLFALPGIVIVIIVAAKRGRVTHGRMESGIVWAAVLLVLVQVAYYAYYAAGITASLYDGGKGFYFSENDVLHVGMILWLGFVLWKLGPTLADRDDAPTEDTASEPAVEPAA